MIRYFLRSLAFPALLAALAVLAYFCQRGAFYETGAQYYDSCWQHARAWGFDAKSPEQAALWAQCEPLSENAFFQAGYELGSNDPNPEHIAYDPHPKGIDLWCPNAFADVPNDNTPANDALFGLVVKLIQDSGGPTLLDQFEPAHKLILRVLDARWPRCQAAVNAASKASP